MRFPFLNATMRKYLSWRYKRIEAIRKTPFQVQENTFKYLINQGQKTEWGSKYNFGKVRNLANYKNQVPIMKYEDIAPHISRAISGEKNILWPKKTKYFAKSSGTSDGKSKFIPISHDKLRLNQIQSGWDALALYYHQKKTANIFTKKSMILCGSIKKSDCVIGDVSAILLDRMPKFGRAYYSPDFNTGLIEDWEKKLEIMASKSIHDSVVMLAGVPSWTSILFQKMLKNTSKSHIQEIWPDFQLYYHGGVSFDPYRKIFNEFFPLGIDYFEVYNASEGYIAIQNDLQNDDLLLLLDNGIFFEFLPLSEIDTIKPITLQLAELEVGVHYALVISCCAGLWRYLLGDTIEISSKFPFTCKVSGRTQHYINTFGEELMICNTDKAIAASCNEFGVNIVDYTVAPIFFDSKQKAGHEWLIEFVEEPLNLSEFSSKLDLELQRNNSDYEAKRFKNILLNPLKIKPVPRGVFQLWMKEMGRNGAQGKVPRLSNDRKYVDQILHIMKDLKMHSEM